MPNDTLTVPVLPVDGANLNELKAMGIIVTFSVGGEVEHQKVVDAFALVGLGEYAPKPRTLRDALKEGLIDLYSKKNCPVRPTPRGYEVVEETPQKDGIHLTRSKLVAAFIERDMASGSDVVRVDDPNRFAEVTAAVAAARGRVNGTDIGKALAEVASHALAATTIRDAGGAYWLPPSQVGTWRTLAETLAATGAVRFRSFTVTGDAGTVESIVDSAKHKVETMLATFAADLDGGKLGPRALTTLAEDAERLVIEVEMWAKALGVGLDAMREKIEEVQVRAGQAAAAALSAESAA